MDSTIYSFDWALNNLISLGFGDSTLVLILVWKLQMKNRNKQMYASRLESITVPILFRIYFFEFFYCVFSFSVNQTKGKRMPIAKFLLNLFISCSMPEKKQIKTRPTLKKESEDEFVLKNSFKANRCDRYFIEGKSFCKSGVLCSMRY